MLITCKTSAINKAIQTALRAIISKPTTPIFSGLHLIAQAGRLTVEGMDLSMAISCTLDAEVEEEGEALISARHLSELVRKLSSEEITINTERDKKSVRLEAGKSSFNLLAMDENDYPRFPSFESASGFTLSGEAIGLLIRKTVYACSQDEARPLFTGVLAEVADKRITFVGTNTHRLAIKSMEIDAEDLSVIIPAKVLQEIIRDLSDEEAQEVEISILRNEIMVKIDDIVIVSRLIEGRFPDYRKVIPRNFAITSKANAKELAGAIERIALFSTEGNYSTIKMSFGAGDIVITSSSPDVGSGREVVSCETEGGELKVAFNAKYLLEILKNLDGDDAIFSLNESLKPATVTSEEDKDYVYIVTPLRVTF